MQVAYAPVVDEHDKPPKYLTTDDIADLLAVSPQTVRRWARNGLLKPAFRLPNNAGQRFTMTEVERFLDAHRGNLTDDRRDD